MRGLDPGGLLTGCSLPRGVPALGLQPRHFDPLGFLSFGLLSSCLQARGSLALSLHPRRFDPLSFLSFGFHSCRFTPLSFQPCRLDPLSFLLYGLLAGRRLLRGVPALCLQPRHFDPLGFLSFGFHSCRFKPLSFQPRRLDPLSFLLCGHLAGRRLPRGVPALCLQPRHVDPLGFLSFGFRSCRFKPLSFQPRRLDPLSFLLRGLLPSRGQPSGLLVFGFQPRPFQSLYLLAGGLLPLCLLLRRHPPRRFLTLRLLPSGLGACRLQLRCLPFRRPLRMIECANLRGSQMRVRGALLQRGIVCIVGRRPCGPWTRGTWRFADHGRWHGSGDGNSQRRLFRLLQGNHCRGSARKGRRTPGGLGSRRGLRSCAGGDVWPWLGLRCRFGPRRRHGLRRHRLGSRGLGGHRSLRKREG